MKIENVEQYVCICCVGVRGVDLQKKNVEQRFLTNFFNIRQTGNQYLYLVDMN